MKCFPLGMIQPAFSNRSQQEKDPPPESESLPFSQIWNKETPETQLEMVKDWKTIFQGADIELRKWMLRDAFERLAQLFSPNELSNHAQYTSIARMILTNTLDQWTEWFQKGEVAVHVLEATGTCKSRLELLFPDGKAYYLSYKSNGSSPDQQIYEFKNIEGSCRLLFNPPQQKQPYGRLRFQFQGCDVPTWAWEGKKVLDILTVLRKQYPHLTLSQPITRKKKSLGPLERLLLKLF